MTPFSGLLGTRLPFRTPWSSDLSFFRDCSKSLIALIFNSSGTLIPLSRTRVPDLGKQDQGGLDVPIEKISCTKDGLALTTLANRRGEVDSAIGIFPNVIIWLLETQNTSLWLNKGAECETGGIPSSGLPRKLYRCCRRPDVIQSVASRSTVGPCGPNRLIYLLLVRQYGSHATSVATN